MKTRILRVAGWGVGLMTHATPPLDHLRALNGGCLKRSRIRVRENRIARASFPVEGRE